MNKDVFTWASVDTAAARSDHPAFSSVFSQAQTNKGKQDSSLMCLLWVSVTIYRPSCLWHQFMSFFSFCSSREPHPSNSDDVPRSKMLLFMFCFYFWNTDTLNQNCYARTIEVTTSVSSGNDGDKWDFGAFVSSTVEHNFSRGCHSDDETCSHWLPWSISFSLSPHGSLFVPREMCLPRSHLLLREPEWDSEAFCPNQLFLSG